METRTNFPNKIGQYIIDIIVAWCLGITNEKGLKA